MKAMIQGKNDIFFTTAEASKYLGFQTDTIRRYHTRGLIACIKMGNTLLVAKSECDRYKREKKSSGRPKKD